MPINQVVNAAKEQTVKPKGFFRKIGSYMSKLCGGKTEKEVAECKGKSLSEMAEMTSKKDTVEIASPQVARRNALREKVDVEYEKFRIIDEKYSKICEEIKHHEKMLKDMDADVQILKLEREISAMKNEIEHLDMHPYRYDSDVCRDMPNKFLAENIKRRDYLKKEIQESEKLLEGYKKFKTGEEEEIKKLKQEEDRIWKTEYLPQRQKNEELYKEWEASF